MLLPLKPAAKGDGIVTGHVLSPAGKVVSGARVDIPVAGVSMVPIDVNLTLGEKSVTLDTAIVTARRNIALEKNGFTACKHAGGGHFFTAEDFDHRKPNNVTDMLKNLPSIMVRNEVPSRFRGMGGNCLTLVIWTEFRGKAKK